MKTTNSKFLAPLTQADLETLTELVKETIAHNTPLRPTFTCADLWKVHRQYRTSSSRRSH